MEGNRRSKRRIETRTTRSRWQTGAKKKEGREREEEGGMADASETGKERIQKTRCINGTRKRI